MVSRTVQIARKVREESVRELAVYVAKRYRKAGISLMPKIEIFTTKVYLIIPMILGYTLAGTVVFRFSIGQDGLTCDRAVIDVIHDRLANAAMKFLAVAMHKMSSR